MRLLLDRKTVAVLKIKRLTFFEWIVRWVLRALVSILENVYRKIVAVFGNRFGNLIMSALTNIPSEWKQGLFRIPSRINEKPKSPSGNLPRE
jgi:hypothetical protein